MKARIFAVAATVVLQCPCADGAGILEHVHKLRGGKSSQVPAGFPGVDPVGGALPASGALPVAGAAGMPPQPQAPFGCCDVSMQPPPVIQEPEVPQDLSDTFVLEWTRLAGSGLIGGRPTTDEAALCLTVNSKRDTVGGMGLQMHTCESSITTFGTRAINRTDPGLKRRQEFVLDASGRVQSKERGLCIRRMRCGKHFMYDVGDCEGVGYIASFEVKRPLFNSMSKLRMLGTPEFATEREDCITCGPYLLTEKCVYRGKTDSRGGQGTECGGSWQGPLGWTKWPASYVGRAAIEGRAPYVESLDTFEDRLPGKENPKDMAGLAPAAFEGVCGSNVADGPTFDSVFVMHRLPREGGRRRA